jgi:hypothetical protein
LNEKKKKSASEIRKEIGISFPKGFTEANYDYETYMSNHIKELESKIEHYESELTKLINDDRVPLVVGFWISEIMAGKDYTK